MIQQFAHHEYLTLAPFALVIWLVGRWLFQKANDRIFKALGPKNAAYLNALASPTRRSWKLFLQALVVGLILLALARPQGGESELPVVSEGVEIMLVVDVSESMLAEDLRPSRLAQAKAELSRLIDLLPGHKIGIVAFAGSASLLSPLSTDPGALKMYLDSLSPVAVSSQGTNFRAALSEAQAAFHRGGAKKDEGVQVTRVILVASDGEDHEEGALEEAKKLVQEGVRIFSLVYGTEKGAPIPVRDTAGNLTGYKKDRSGQTILTTVKGEALRALAEAGRGAFHFSSFGGDHLRLIVEDINRLEKTQFETKTNKQYEERFQLFLLAALIFAVLELILSHKRSQNGKWRGRFELPQSR